jgi:hypothetical protein
MLAIENRINNCLLMVADESSMMSEESSFWGDEREQYLSDASENRWSDVPSTSVLEQLSQELANRGSPESEVKLR